MQKERLYELMSKIGGMPINENNVIHLTKKEFLSEIDWKGEFSDVGHACLKPEAIVKWLNDELNRLKSNKTAKQSDKVTRKLDVPIMSKGNIERMSTDSGDINIDMFINNITREPKTLFDSNSKMEKSDVGRPQLTVNTGLPAIVGIVYDIENEEFHSVTTCPGAGTCQIGCYARKAFYEMNNSLVMKLTQRLNLLLNDPKRFEERTFGELLGTVAVLPKGHQLFIRWNDAGDFFGDKYIEIAKNVTKKLIDSGYDVKSYAHTKRGDYVMALDDDENFAVSFSTDASKAEQEKIEKWGGSKNVKKSHNVPAYKTEKRPYKRKEGEYEVKIPQWKHFFERKGPHYIKDKKGKPKFATESAPKELKDYIYNMYNDKIDLNYDSLKYTWELPFNDEGGRKYNVIVLPTGDSDISAQREDVKNTFLLEH